MTKPMTRKEYRETIADLGVSQALAGKFLGVDQRTSRRWIAGDSEIPTSAVKLLRLMLAKRITIEQVNELTATKQE